mmetsp:Transcript_45033/g.71943  ORF Transcript_45033/g.71943 Transcript_45033/m.71943 type:complete len:565 (-) Transcript_45033:260-1954(-)
MRVLFALLKRLNLKKWAQWYLAFALVHLVWKFYKVYRSMQRRLRSIKGLPGHQRIDFACEDFLKNVNRIHEWRRDFLLQYSGKPLVRTASPDIEVMCNTKESVKVLLRSEFRKITKPGPEEDYGFYLLGQFIGQDGIFILRHGDLLPEEHVQWYNQRKTASKIFTKSNFLSMIQETVSNKMDILNRHLGTIADQNEGLETTKRSEGATAVDIQEKFFSFTFDSIQQMFFGREVNSIEGKADTYASAFDACHRSMLRHMFGSMPLNVASQYLLPFPFGSLYLGSRTWNPLFNLVRRYFDPHYADFRKQIDFLDSRTYALIKEAREDPKLSKRRDLLAYFLNSDVSYTDKQLRDVILNFIIAGRDTTACVLSWLFYELTQNPRVQVKLIEEIDQVLAGRRPTLEDLSPTHMPYLNGVFMEALRLHPPVPEDSKMCTEDVQFPDGTTIAAGVKLMFSPYSIGRDPSIFDEPLQFKPERWIPFTQPCMFEFPVFQAGNRYCLGKDLATFEGKLITASLLQNFTFALEGDEKPENITYALMITMSLCNKPDQTSHNLWVVPKRRTQKLS